MTARYAERTEVGSDRSRAEIERTLRRYGHLIRFHKGGCWEWTGSIDPAGYGRASLSKTKHRKAHIVIYEAFRGPVPCGLDLDHLCHGDLCAGGVTCPHRRCVNPDHLKPATRRENLARGMHPSAIVHRTNTCIRGHEMTLANTYTSPKGARQCRACNRIREQRRTRRMVAA